MRATIIPCRIDRLSSELRSQSALGSISTGLRDHLGTRSVVVLLPVFSAPILNDHSSKFGAELPRRFVWCRNEQWNGLFVKITTRGAGWGPRSALFCMLIAHVRPHDPPTRCIVAYCSTPAWERPVRAHLPNIQWHALGCNFLQPHPHIWPPACPNCPKEMEWKDAVVGQMHNHFLTKSSCQNDLFPIPSEPNFRKRAQSYTNKKETCGVLSERYHLIDVWWPKTCVIYFISGLHASPDPRGRLLSAQTSCRA